MTILMAKKYTFADYQKDSRKTAGYPPIGHPIIYPVLGLSGEAGEISEKIKKIFRDKKGEISSEDKEMLKLELGDVLWYLTQIASELKVDLEEVAQKNIAKLYSRMERGKLGGSGDKR
jgi:NTP pyrophosphatase (non-canonical NTP hydrolase)